MSVAINRFPVRAFGLAILIETALLIVVILVLAGTVQVKHALSEPVPITLLADATPQEKPQPQQPKPPPEPKAKPQVSKSRPQPAPQPQPALQSQPAPLPVPPAPTAFTEPVPTPVPAPPPAASGKADPSLEYAARVRAAVQAAIAYPPAAAALHFSGRVRVEFHLRDGAPSQEHVVIVSGVGMIDRAALSSVQNAQYPAPPPELRGADRTYQVWVEFHA